MANKRAERKFVTESSYTPQLVTLRASDKPLTELCEITKEACEAVAPMLNGTTITLSHYLTPAYTICHSSTHIAFITSFRAILSD